MLAALAGATAFAATGYHNTVTIDAPGAPNVVVNGLNGDVNLRASNTNRVHIVAQLHAESQKNLDQMAVKTAVHGQTLQIQSLCPQSGYWIFHITRCSVNYTITYPRGSRVTVHNDNGNVSVEGTASDVEIDNNHGDVQTTLARDWHGGTISARTAMGNIRLTVPTGFTGHLKAKTWFGDVKNGAALSTDNSGASVTLQTRFGDITVIRV